MPTYEYECRECSHHFEAFQAMSDEPIKVCPKCGKEVRRLIFGGAGVIFKGSGFYVTDKKDSSKSALSKSVGKSETAGTASATCASCPAATADGGCPAADAGTGEKKAKTTA
ncbi:MAG: zinc ribbon domain-containing protein [Treponema sp.]|nr:zinc ribbon domain-containing protein [Treponema sp.]